MGRTTKRTGKTAALESGVAVSEHEHDQREDTHDAHDAHETRTGGEDWRALRNRGRDELPAEYAEEGEHLPPEEAVLVAEGEEDAHAPDDALGLYLRQMGAIPLLNREQELALAERLELRRRRYRHAAPSNWRTLSRVVETFERVQAGQLALDPTIDVVTTLELSRENILARMPHNLKTLRHLIGAADADFRNLQRAGSAAARSRSAVVPPPTDSWCCRSVICRDSSASSRVHRSSRSMRGDSSSTRVMARRSRRASSRRARARLFTVVALRTLGSRRRPGRECRAGS